MKWLLGIGTFCALIGCSLQIWSAEPQAKLKHRPFNGTIKEVNRSARTIVLRGEKAQTFFIIPETKIKRDGQPIRFEQIAAGESLGGYARQVPDGRWEALTLNFGEKPTAPSGGKSQTNGPPSKVRR
jgi:hypothetical protein